MRLEFGTFSRPADWRAVFAIVLCAMLWLVPGPLSAQEKFAPGSTCHISVDKSVSYDQALADPSAWKCEGAEFEWRAERHIIRHTLDGSLDPRAAEFDRYEFERLEVIVEGEDGRRLSREYGFRDLKMGASSLKAMVELPNPGTPIANVIFIHEGGWFPETFVATRLAEKPQVPVVAGHIHLLAALLCGLLLAPIIFDIGFFRALREPFPLYHALFCLMAFVQTAAVSGLLPMMVVLDYETELNVTYLSLDLMVAATFLFAYHFIEDGRLPRRYRRWLLVLPVLTLANGIVSTFAMDVYGEWIDHIYFSILVSIFAGYFFILWQAFQQHSRMAPYLAFGIAPLAFIVLLQAVIVYTLPEAFIFDETWAQNFALLFEVIATALAVADRFIRIRRERDQAITIARDLEVLSEHDELTGLRNRRALDARYGELVREGFHAMAVVDIDRFKSINDIHGHPVGDLVLRSAAWALSPGDDNDLVAFRIGGEEFLLLLRGEDALEKAEERRLAVTQRVMAGVDEIHRPVTASMGIVDFSAIADEPGLSFSSLYSQVDRLLYEAKVAGRNRTRSQIVEALPDRRAGDRRVAA
ncbi:GGDEF domain-containing protein [Qipengyuania vesicularis]|uniref:GGDEF domain-containing protein n=1 Tax=Qipengyuania vesicularis TaxID=2867232 RepID=UPI001C88167C|nr:diguanylate cyclase [Qipengyuania vesicularis]MBX7527976.1 diguanylate cyclase [Qipengyuania vesicularis]